MRVWVRRLCEKQADGRHSAAVAVWLLPYFIVVRLNMADRLRGVPRKRGGGGKCACGQHFGGGGIRSGGGCVAEYPLFRRPEHYAAVPMLDMVPPECADLIRAVRLLEQMRAGRPVLVCCALGYGRSAAVVLLWLWAHGGCADLNAAVVRLRQVRPQMVLPNAVRQSIQTAKREMEQA